MTRFPTFRRFKTWLQSIMKEYLARFPTLRRRKTLMQNIMKEYLTRFPTLGLLKIWLQSIMKEYLTWFAIFHLIAKHCEKDLDSIFYFKGTQNFIEEPNGREFYKISDCGLHDEFLNTPLNYAYIDFLQRYEHLDSNM